MTESDANSFFGQTIKEETDKAMKNEDENGEDLNNTILRCSCKGFHVKMNLPEPQVFQVSPE